jgi:FKBP-type peptidyl-prolyl cis-trans isomerase FklB
MKLTIYPLLISILFITQSAYAEMAPKTEKEKLSYSMGTFFAQTVIRQNIDVDITAFLQAVEDVLNGKDPKIAMQEMQQLLTAYQQKEQEEQNAAAVKNQQAGIEFLKKNKEKEGWKELESGLQYKVLEGGTGKSPATNDTILVHYRGTFIDGSEFDSSYNRGEPIELAVNRVIPGWQEALQLMKVGGKLQIAVPSDLAYGQRGSDIIGPNSVLLFDIELIEIK